jgi:hypothetical protein
MNEKLYTTSGVIAILKFNDFDEEFVALVKRTKDAKNSPDTHSGFFGHADPEDNNNPFVTASREFAEELLFAYHNKVYSFYINDVTDKTVQNKVEELFEQWKSRRDFSENLEFQNLTEISDELDFNDGRELRKIFLLPIKLDCTIDDLTLLDCEDFNGKILDRQVDVFKFKELRDWWHSDRGSLKAVASYKTGQKVELANIDRAKISSTLNHALNCSKLFTN